MEEELKIDVKETTNSDLEPSAYESESVEVNPIGTHLPTNEVIQEVSSSS